MACCVLLAVWSGLVRKATSHFPMRLRGSRVPGTCSPSCRAQASPVLALGCPNQGLALVCSPHWVPCSQHRGPGVVHPDGPSP